MTRTGRTLLLAVAIVVALPGCATSGRPFDSDRVTHIVPGRTTNTDVRRLFGEPTGVRVRANGGSQWVYEYRERQRADTGFLARVWNTVAWITGRRGVHTPVNVGVGRETRHQLVVYFGRDGIADDYSYERSSLPTASVY